MPSFFEGLKRLAQGKPVFQETVDSQQAAAEPQSSESNQTRRTPKVYIEQIESDIANDTMQTYADIRNDSEETVLIDKIRLLGTKREIDTTLKPNESREILIYSGAAPKSKSNHDAELQYKDMSGNYYKARHDVRFEPHGDRFIVVKMPYENTSRI